MKNISIGPVSSWDSICDQRFAVVSVDGVRVADIVQVRWNSISWNQDVKARSSIRIVFVDNRSDVDVPSSDFRVAKAWARDFFSKI